MGLLKGVYGPKIALAVNAAEQTAWESYAAGLATKTATSHALLTAAGKLKSLDMQVSAA